MSLATTTWPDVGGFVLMAATMAALARWALPRAWAPGGRRGAIAAAIAFACVLAANETGALGRVHEELFNRVGGEFDEMATWLVALAGAGAVVAVERVVRRALAKEPRSGDLS